MAFNYSLEKKGDTLKIHLAGRLDAGSAPVLSDSLQKYKGKGLKNLVFLAEDLEYISSAGIRVIIFAKQKIGEEATVHFIKARDFVKEVIDMTGLGGFLIFRNDYTD